MAPSMLTLSMINLIASCLTEHKNDTPPLNFRTAYQALAPNAEIAQLTLKPFTSIFYRVKRLCRDCYTFRNDIDKQTMCLQRIGKRYNFGPDDIAAIMEAGESIVKAEAIVPLNLALEDVEGNMRMVRQFHGTFKHVSSAVTALATKSNKRRR